MKKGWKRFWIICGSVFLTGVILCLIAASLGFTWGSLAQEYSSEWGYEWFMNGWHDVEDEWHDSHTRLDIGTESGSFTKEFDGITKMDLEMAAGTLELRTYDEDKIRLEAEDINSRLDFRCYQEGSVLYIRTSKNVWKNNGLSGKKGGTATLWIPEKKVPAEIKSCVGAGYLNMDGVETTELEVEVGAGNADITAVQAAEMELHCGTGGINASCKGKGNIDIDCGVGNVTLTVAGSEDQYNEEITCGIGKIYVGSRTYHGMGKEVELEKGAPWDLSVQCGIGDVKIDFEK